MMIRNKRLGARETQALKHAVCHRVPLNGMLNTASSAKVKVMMVIEDHSDYGLIVILKFEPLKICILQEICLWCKRLKLYNSNV